MDVRNQKPNNSIQLEIKKLQRVMEEEIERLKEKMVKMEMEKLEHEGNLKVLRKKTEKGMRRQDEEIRALKAETVGQQQEIQALKKEMDRQKQLAIQQEADRQEQADSLTEEMERQEAETDQKIRQQQEAMRALKADMVRQREETQKEMKQPAREDVLVIGAELSQQELFTLTHPPCAKGGGVPVKHRAVPHKSKVRSQG